MATVTNDLKKIRRKKKRNKFFRKLIVVLFILSFIFVAYILRARWLPYFDGIMEKYHKTIVNDGELASGKFPLKIETSSEYRISNLDNNFTVLTDTHLFFYGQNGELLRSKQHGMSNPVLKTSSKRALVYDLGGDKLFVSNKSKTIFKLDLDDKIAFAQISKKGYVAVVTKSEKFASEMTVFNANGNKIFYISSNNEIMNVAFESGSDGCLVTTLAASGGQFVSTVYNYKFDKKKESWKSSDINSLILSAQFASGGNVTAVGNSKLCSVSSSGDIKFTYEYKTDLVGYAASSDISALVFNNMKLRKTTLTIIDGDKVLDININGEYKNVLVKNNKVYLMTDKELIAYSNDGQILATAKLTKEYSDFIVIEDKVYLLGISIVDRIEFKT